MDLEAFNTVCRSLPATHPVVQWAGAHVWKVATKVFAFARDDGDGLHVTFKVSSVAYDILKEQPGCRPAPYLASRGMKWIQRTDPRSMSDAALADYIRESYNLVAGGLPRKVRAELGLAGEHNPPSFRRR